MARAWPFGNSQPQEQEAEQKALQAMEDWGQFFEENCVPKNAALEKQRLPWITEFLGNLRTSPAKTADLLRDLGDSVRFIGKVTDIQRSLGMFGVSYSDLHSPCRICEVGKKVLICPNKSSKNPSQWAVDQINCPSTEPKHGLTASRKPCRLYGPIIFRSTNKGDVVANNRDLVVQDFSHIFGAVWFISTKYRFGAPSSSIFKKISAFPSQVAGLSVQADFSISWKRIFVDQARLTICFGCKTSCAFAQILFEPIWTKLPYRAISVVSSLFRNL